MTHGTVIATPGCLPSLYCHYIVNLYSRLFTYDCSVARLQNAAAGECSAVQCWCSDGSQFPLHSDDCFACTVNIVLLL